MAFKRVLLSTYSLRIFDHTNTPVNLDNFNNEKNFYKFLDGFFLEVYKTIKKNPNISDKSTLHLKLKNKAITDNDNRSIYGYLSSGVGGDKFTVIAEDEIEPAFEADPDKHITFRDLFFYIETPPQKDYAYLIIQRTKSLGGKYILQSNLTKYLQEKSYLGFKAVIFNSLDKRVYNKMIEHGNLKKIDFIKRRIPNSMEEYYNNPSNEYSSKGTLTTTIQARVSLTTYWKNFVNALYLNSGTNSKLEISDGTENYDEIDFTLEYNGKIKTFHIQNQGRTQPDIDVTQDVDFPEGSNEPTTESLVKISQELVRDVLTLKPLNVQ